MKEGHLPNYARVEKPWGSFERFTLNEPSTVKIIDLKPSELFSLQTHKNREEFWRILGGSGTIIIGEQTHETLLGADYHIPKGAKHRAQAGPQGLRLLEIALGQFDEEDIIRLEDKYGRA